MDLKSIRLFHGTSSKYLNHILKHGISPASVTGNKGNWEHTITAHQDAVYLSTSYAPYFAMCSIKNERKEKALIIEVDPSQLQEEFLYPDEDVLPHIIKIEDSESLDINIITQYFRDNIKDYQQYWEASLALLGNCAYHQIIPPKAFKTVALFDQMKNKSAWMKSVDPSIIPINYQILGHNYFALTRWMIGEKVTPQEVSHTYGHFPEFDRGLEEMLENQPVEIIYKSD